MLLLLFLSKAVNVQMNMPKSTRHGVYFADIHVIPRCLTSLRILDTYVAPSIMRRGGERGACACKVFQDTAQPDRQGGMLLLPPT